MNLPFLKYGLLTGLGLGPMRIITFIEDPQVIKNLVR